MSSRLLASLSLAVLASLCAASATAPTRPAPREGEWPDLEWLAGPWESRSGDAVVEEHWTPLAGGTMFGVNRTIQGGRTVAFEFLRLEERPDGIVYVAHPGARSPGTEFVLTYHDEHEVVFENPAHDFPTVIRYRRDADGSMTATVGGGETGEESALAFPFARPEATDEGGSDD